MPKVKLQTAGNGSKIVAPDFCPFKQTDLTSQPSQSQVISTVSPSLCAVCKYCTFLIDISTDEHCDLSVFEKEKFIKYLTETNTQVSSALIAQKQYLSKQNRAPLAILLTPSLALQAFQYICSPNAEQAKVKFNYYRFHESPICEVYGCPVYVSRKLSKSFIQLVGDIVWK